MRSIYDPEHEEFRSSVRTFIDREITPRHAEWEACGVVDRDLYRIAAKQGLIGFNVPEEYGGGGVDDFRFNSIVTGELAYAQATGPAFALQNDMVMPYMLELATPQQKERWLPGFADGSLIGAIAMSEPGAGSDLASIRLSAARVDGGWSLNGVKTFITSGLNSDVVIVVARTDPEAGRRGLSLLVVERDMPGFSRGRRLKKLGLTAQDTAELVFEDVFVPDSHLLGEEGGAFYHLVGNLPSERVSIAVAGAYGSRGVLDRTLTYVKERQIFGAPVGAFQANRFTLAEMHTEVAIADAYVQACVQGLCDRTLTAVEAAQAKWWVTEMQQRVVSQCLQLHGGYGYMTEYPDRKSVV